MVTLYDIAKITGLSVSTVTRILSGKAGIRNDSIERVFLAAKLTGFLLDEVNDATGNLLAKYIGVIVEEGSFSNGLEHPLFSGILQSFQKRMASDGYNLIFLSKTANPNLSYIDFCKEKNIKGLLIVNSIYTDKEVSDLVESGMPCVSSNEFIPGICTVVSENTDAARKGTEYLIAKGHTKIAFMGGPQTVNCPSTMERLEGYKIALRGAGIKYDASYVEYAAKWELDAGFLAAKKLLKKAPDFTAVFCASDLLAAGAIKYFHSVEKKVPEDISVIGFDDSLIASCSSPAITTFRQDREKIGAVCAEKLTSAMAGISDYSIIRLPVKFIERESVADIHNF